MVALVLLAAGCTGVASAHSDPVLGLMVSSSAARSPASPLSGATVGGLAHVFLPTIPEVRQVDFFLDDPQLSGPPRQVEKTAPYDLAGGTAGAASPLDTRSLTNGAHTISVRVTFTDDDLALGETTFTVDNAAAPPAAPTLRLNSGGPAVTTGGVSWAADSFATGGKSYANSKVTAIAGTTDDVLHLTERSATTNLGSFGYAIPASTAGTYTVRLHFAEIWFGATGGGTGGAGKRVFSANVEGGAVELVDYDIFREVGAMRASVKSFSRSVTDGTLNIDFSAKVNQPKVSAVEVVFPSGSTLPPLVPSRDVLPPFSWESLTDAPIGRSEAQGAAVGSKVYVFGGFYSGNLTTARSDVFDTVTGTWTRLPDLPEQVTHSPAVVVGTTIWLLGGYVGDHPGPATVNVHLFDTVTRTWSEGPQLPFPRGAGGAGLIGTELHFFGGTDRVAGSTADPDQPDHWVIDVTPAPDGQPRDWQSLADLPNPRNHLASAVLDGRLYAIGGQHNDLESTGLQAQVDRYDPADDAWTRLADLPRSRSHSVAVVRDGRIMVLGGSNEGATASRDVTLYDPESNAWAKLPSLPGGRKTAVAALIGDVVHFTGGSHARATYAGRFANRWETGTAMPLALGEVAGGVIGSTLYLVGQGNQATLALDLATGTWRSNLAVRPFVGNHHAAEVIAGRLYLFGGLGAGAGKVQVYDPATNAWRLGTDMPFAAGSSSSAVIGGQAYVAGGIVGSTTTALAARYDPVADTWLWLPAMPQGRNHAAAGTDGSTLYVFGGRTGGNTVSNGFGTTQVYDPVAGTWESSDTTGSTLVPLPQARGGTGKAVFYRGELFVIGGETTTGAGATSSGVYARVDTYDPVTGTWRRGSDLPTARHGIYPVLHNGRITVAGGGIKAGSSSSAVTETYNPLR